MRLLLVLQKRKEEEEEEEKLFQCHSWLSLKRLSVLCAIIIVIDGSISLSSFFSLSCIFFVFFSLYLISPLLYEL